MTSNRKAILVFLTICIVALGVAFGYRYQKEKTDIAGIQAGQEWANRGLQTIDTPTADELFDYEPGEPQCIHDYIDRGSLLFKDGTEFCLTWERETTVVDNDNVYDPMRVTNVFSLVSPDGVKREIARRVEGYQYTKSNEHVAIPGLPKASNWFPVGISADEKLVYFTRSQGLPIDGFSTGKRLDLWSLDITTGKLTQIYRTGDIWDWSQSPEIVDVNISSKRMIVRDYINDQVKVIGFDGKNIATLHDVPFTISAPQTLSDREEYRFSQNGYQIIVTAWREEPFGSGKEQQYGPVVLDIVTGKYLK